MWGIDIYEELIFPDKAVSIHEMATSYFIQIAWDESANIFHAHKHSIITQLYRLLWEMVVSMPSENRQTQKWNTENHQVEKIKSGSSHAELLMI